MSELTLNEFCNADTKTVTSMAEMFNQEYFGHTDHSIAKSVFFDRKLNLSGKDLFLKSYVEPLNCSVVNSWYNETLCDEIPTDALLDESEFFPDSSTFIADTEWDGVIVELKSDVTVLARVWDVAHGQDEGEELFEVVLDKVRVVGRDLCREGAIFRWSFGYLRGNQGRKIKHSRIVFRRVPLWSRDEVERIQKLAHQRVNNLSEF